MNHKLSLASKTIEFVLTLKKNSPTQAMNRSGVIHECAQIIRANAAKSSSRRQFPPRKENEISQKKLFFEEVLDCQIFGYICFPD